MKRRLLLIAMALSPAMGLGAGFAMKGAGKSGGPLDKRRENMDKDNDQQDSQQQSKGKQETADDKSDTDDRAKSSD